MYWGNIYDAIPLFHGMHCILSEIQFTLSCSLWVSIPRNLCQIPFIIIETFLELALFTKQIRIIRFLLPCNPPFDSHPIPWSLPYYQIWITRYIPPFLSTFSFPYVSCPWTFFNWECFCVLFSFKNRTTGITKNSEKFSFPWGCFTLYKNHSKRRNQNGAAPDQWNPCTFFNRR